MSETMANTATEVPVIKSTNLSVSEIAEDMKPVSENTISPPIIFAHNLSCILKQKVTATRMVAKKK